MGVFDKVLNVLMMMFGSTNYSKIAITGDVIKGKITSFEAREDGTLLSVLTDIKGTDILADCLNGQELYKGEWFTDPNGFKNITVLAGSLKVNGSSINIT